MEGKLKKIRACSMQIDIETLIRWMCEIEKCNTIDVVNQSRYKIFIQMQEEKSIGTDQFDIE